MGAARRTLLSLSWDCRWTHYCREMEDVVDPQATPDQRALLGSYRELRRARRRHYLNQIDWLEGLYRVYVAAIVGGVALALIAGALNDTTATLKDVHGLADAGPAWVGLAVAIAVAAGLRSGGHGGPLAIEGPDVQYVLLSPLGRGRVLRGLAARQLRTAALAGAAAGLIVANFAFRRLPGSAVDWFAALGVVGVLMSVLAPSSALLASGRRLRPPVVGASALLIIAWSVVDLAFGTQTSPATMLGQLALLPIHSGAAGLVQPAIGVAIALAVIALALTWVGGTSLEAAERRAGLTSQLRFAVTVQDLRAVILLRRQLAAELPRSRPWLRLAGRGARRRAIWTRDWQSFLRWPVVRVARIIVLGAVAGLALCGAWQGTTPLVVVAGAALFLASLDAVEPLAQEIDHPTCAQLLPVRASRLLRAHLVAASVLLLTSVVVALGAALVAGASSSLALEIAIPMAVPTALLGSTAAAFSTTNDPFAHVLNPGITAVLSGLPPAIAVIGVSGPFLAARAAEQHGGSALAAVLSSELVVWLACLGVLAWLRRRIDAQLPVTGVSQ